MVGRRQKTAIAVGVHGNVNLNWPQCDGEIGPTFGRVRTFSVVAALAQKMAVEPRSTSARRSSMCRCGVEEGHRGHYRGWSVIAVSAS
jgi:hypothetical protein